MLCAASRKVRSKWVASEKKVTCKTGDTVWKGTPKMTSFRKENEVMHLVQDELLDLTSVEIASYAPLTFPNPPILFVIRDLVRDAVFAFKTPRFAALSIAL